MWGELFTYDGALYAFNVQTYNLPQLVYVAVLHEVIGQAHASDGRLIAVLAHPFENGSTQSTLTHAVFNRDDTAELPAHLMKDVLVKGLQETHIVVGHGNVLLFSCKCRELVDGLLHVVADGADARAVAGNAIRQADRAHGDSV